jgi:hypothetical protein
VPEDESEPEGEAEEPEGDDAAPTGRKVRWPQGDSQLNCRLWGCPTLAFTRQLGLPPITTAVSTHHQRC